MKGNRNLKKYHYRCPHCSYSFWRQAGKLSGTTRCSACRQNFSRSEGTHADKFGTAEAFDIAPAVQTESFKKIRSHEVSQTEGPIPHSISYEEIVRGAQVPKSAAEAMFKNDCFRQGWLPHRPSWPDFLVETPGQPLLVEVKSESDSVSREQHSTFDVLEAMGLPIFIWKKVSPTKGEMIKWSDFKKIKSKETSFQPSRGVTKATFLSELSNVRENATMARSRYSKVIKIALSNAGEAGNEALEDMSEIFLEMLAESFSKKAYVEFPLLNNLENRAAHKIWRKFVERNPAPHESNFVAAVVRGSTGSVNWVVQEMIKNSKAIAGLKQGAH